MGIIVLRFITFYILLYFFIKVSPVAFVRVRKISKSDYKLRHVHLSVRTKKFISHRPDFGEIWYLKIFKKSAEKNQVLLKFHKNNWYFTQRPVYIYDHTSVTSS
jgi:hypothetical protein